MTRPGDMNSEEFRLARNAIIDARTPVLTLAEAERIAAATLAAIAGSRPEWDPLGVVAFYCRDQVESDLAGLRLATNNALAHSGDWSLIWTDHARRYSDGLRRTARLYGDTP